MCTFYFCFLLFGILVDHCLNFHIFQSPNLFSDFLESKYGSFPENLRLEMLDKAKEMFYFGYDSYMKYAFPKDELNPILCSGRGRDYDNPSNININDILGDYSLTLVDSLDTLAVLGNATEFQNAVSLIIQNVDFNKNNTVQVFEVNIRLLGALLSAHLMMLDPKKPFGNLKPEWYEGQLLHLAHDLASRLLPAFDISHTGIPYPRVNLKNGLIDDIPSSESCPAGAGTLLLEMGILSRLLIDPVFEGHARRALSSLWKHRSHQTGLFGNVIDVNTGKWVGKLSGLGAGLDSFYEYLLKSYIIFGDPEDYSMFSSAYASITSYMRKGRAECNAGEGNHPLFVNVDMESGAVLTTWIDSLQAAFSAVQVLHGDVEEAICSHIIYYLIWKKHGVLPERWDWKLLHPNVEFYPLRPELVESTYLLYQATKSPFYLHVGADILNNINTYTRTKCGFATVHKVSDMTLEDRMESFFLSETMKYLYLLFDKDNYINRHFNDFLFSTEGHILPLSSKFRNFENDNFFPDKAFNRTMHDYNIDEPTCSHVEKERSFFLPLKTKYLMQISRTMGVEET